MGFLYPFFLIAGLLLAVPIVIHLFNLRKYKHVLFPNVKFLQQLQITSKRSAQLQKKWLLLSRLLLLAALIMAFAQPYWQSNKSLSNQERLKVLYLDNSLSMSAKKGQETLWQQAVKEAKNLINRSGKDARFIILTNDKMRASSPINGELAIQELENQELTGQVAGMADLFHSLKSAQSIETNAQWEVYIFSDFQKSSFLKEEVKNKEIANIDFFLLPFQLKGANNTWVDTAWLHQASVDGQDNQLIVRTRQSEKSNSTPALRVLINEKTRAVKQLDDFEKGMRYDTISLSLEKGWQKVSLILNDPIMDFDDTFRLAMHPISKLTVAVLSDENRSPYLQTAFNSYPSFQTDWKSVAQNASASNKQDYNLYVLQNVDVVPEATQQMLKEALDNGSSVLLFPGSQPHKESLNRFISSLLPISFSDVDTSRQQVVDINTNHPIFKDLFDQVPENVELPVAQRHFKIHADINAGQQTLLGFRNGSPFLAQYSVGKGKLFIAAASLNQQSSNFMLSNLFVPLIYKMALQSQSDYPMAMEIGSTQPLWIRNVNVSSERGIWHLTAADFDAVPEQRPSGVGTNLYMNQINAPAGYYILTNDATKDSLWIALNVNKLESDITYAESSEIAQAFQPLKINWVQPEEIVKHDWTKGKKPFPIWKILIVLALISMVAETLLIHRKIKPSMS